MQLEKVRDVIKCSSSFRESARKIGSISGQAVKRFAVANEIDFSHFDKHAGMVGKKYGMLTVLEIKTKGENRCRKYARCLCECGREKEARCDGLKTGKYVSCGCHSKNRWNMVCEQNPAFRGKGELRAAFFSAIKKSAKRRDIECSLLLEEAWDIFQQQNGRCALTGLEIHFGRIYFANETTASLDRIDSNKGYVLGNVQWVLKDINMLKGDYNNEYFIKLCNAVAAQHPR